MKLRAMRMALWLSCLLMASCSAKSAGSQLARDPSAPHPCVVLQTDPPQGGQPPEGRGAGWQWGSGRAEGSVAVTQGCTLTVWTEEGGRQTFPSGTGVHLTEWEWTSPPLVWHCTCEKEGPSKDVHKMFKKFIQQHVDPKVPKGNYDNYCNEQMKKVNIEGGCKMINTFIHATKQEVIKVCTTTGMKEGNHHYSKEPFNLTMCRKHKKSCRYTAKNLTKRINITCLDNKPIHFGGIKNQGFFIIP